MYSKRIKIIKTKIKDLTVVDIKSISDSRGFFQRIFCERELSGLLKNKNIVQLNRSFTKKSGSVRGLHFQNPPFAECKLVFCLKGEVYDVAVDLRMKSKTFLKHHSEILNEKNNRMMIIPEGFAHGFQTLSKNTELI